MSSTPQTPNVPGGLPFGCERKDATVNIASLAPELNAALARVGRVHLALFGKPCIITSGNDGKHKNESKHYANKAVDIRMFDKTAEEQAIFIAILCYLDRECKIMLFDERQLPNSEHVHIETAA